MTHASESTRFIYQFHDPAAMNVAEQVSVLGMHQLRNGNARLADGFGWSDLGHCRWSLCHEFTMSVVAERN
jgi:hypothetical protein